MSSRSFRGESSEPGIIILGNAGAGKSFICNILIGHERFKAEFQPEAVTTETEHDWVEVGSKIFRIYNIPGLVEANQESIDRNKREIMKAFDQSPISVVIFVWTQVGGRAQNDDIIAFNALNQAYKFPTGSLMFLVNNIPTRRPRDYEAKFLATLTNTLKVMPVTTDDTFFLDQLDVDDKEKFNEAHSRLIAFVNHHHTALLRKHADIILQSDQIKQMREQIKKQQLEAERDREALQNQIQKLMREYQIAQQNAEKRYERMQSNLEAVEKNAIRERAAREAERRDWEKRQREQDEQNRQREAAREAKRRDWERHRQFPHRYEDPLSRTVGGIAAAPIITVADGIEGLVSGTGEGFMAGAKPFADFADDKENPALLRAAAIPVGAVTGLVGGTAGAVCGATAGIVKGVGRAFGNLFGK